MSDKKLELKLYSNIKSIPVEWLWYPYIPFGKITLIQGDPGEGKSTMMMGLVAALSSGTKTPDGKEIDNPIHVIYQCSEDGVADTIKPRLEKCGANCENIAFVDEDIDPLSLDDERFRDAIIDFRARVLVIDPFQAYVGEGSEDHRTAPHKQRNPREARTSQLCRLLFELNRRMPNGTYGGVRGATC